MSSLHQVRTYNQARFKRVIVYRSDTGIRMVPSESFGELEAHGPIIMMLAGALALFLVGCSKSAVEVHGTDNQGLVVERLFSYDGCDVFRFIDGDVRYFARCRHADVTTTRTWVHCTKVGKSMVCSESQEQVPSVELEN